MLRKQGYDEMGGLANVNEAGNPIFPSSDTLSASSARPCGSVSISPKTWRCAVMEWKGTISLFHELTDCEVYVIRSDISYEVPRTFAERRW